jgi:hypothetical protein
MNWVRFVLLADEAARDQWLAARLRSWQKAEAEMH